MRARPLLLAGLVVWAAFTVAATVLAVLWLRGGDDRELADEVHDQRAGWDRLLDDLRTFESSVGPIWTTDQLRVRAYGDVTMTQHARIVSSEPDVYTVMDSARQPCVPGSQEAGARTVLQLCRDSERGEMSVAENLPPEQTGERTTLTVSEWRTMPGATDARVLVYVEVPSVSETDEDSLRAQLERAMDLAEPRLEAIEVEQLDLDDPAWTDYDFQLGTKLWDTQPAPVVAP